MFEDTYDIFSSLLRNNTTKYPFIPYDYKGKFLSTDEIRWKNIDAFLQSRLSFFGVWIQKYKTRQEIVISEYGWCYIFNVINHNQVYRQNTTPEYFQIRPGQDRPITSRELPKRNIGPAPIFTPSRELGLIAGAHVERNAFVPCFVNKQYGAEPPVECENQRRALKLTFLLHPPFERPNHRHLNFIIENNEKHRLTVTPVIKITDETLLGLDADERMCYQNNEKKLKFFRNYTRNNCLKECESSFIMQKCGCVPYYFINNDTSLICNIDQYSSCFKIVYEKFNEINCKCYPPCQDLNYDVKVQKNEAKNIVEKFFFYSKGLMIIKFKEDSIYPQVRRKYFTMIDWFSFIGGILGLFFGFSFLSGFEIVYYVCKRFLSRKSSAGHARHQNPGIKFNLMKMISRSGSYVRNFLENSSIHGLSYISDVKMKLYERVVWTIAFILSITACYFMIIQLNEKLTINSISISISNDYYNLTQIPFPAFTMMGVYPDNNMNISAYIEYSLPQGPDAKDVTNIRKIVQYFVRGNREDNIFVSIGRDSIRNKTGYGHQIVPIIKKYSANSLEELPRVEWNKQFSMISARILTSRGYNFDFNMVKMEDMFNMNNVSDDFHYTHEFLADGPNDLSLRKTPYYPVYFSEELVYITTNKQKFQPNILMHSPYEYPMEFKDLMENMCDLTIHKMVEVYIVPEIVTTNDELKALPLEQRMCYIDGERKLKFFKIYTLKNCEVECLSGKLNRSCNCVPFDLIRDKTTKVCELVDDQCIELARVEFLFEENDCKCLQPCDFMTYNYEFIETKHKIRKFEFFGDLKSGNDTFFDTRASVGILKFKFKDTEFTTMQRTRQFTIFDCLSYIGGLLGLFAGISVLSLFETFYFFTLRVFCELLRLLKARKSATGHENIIVVIPINAK